MTAARLGSLVAALACVGASAADLPTFSSGPHFDERSGEALYRSICQGCHMPDGHGANGAGGYPSLADDLRLMGVDYPVTIVLAGRRNMPSFAMTLDDAQVAAVVGYVRTHFGNAYTDEVTSDRVGSLR